VNPALTIPYKKANIFAPSPHPEELGGFLLLLLLCYDLPFERFSFMNKERICVLGKVTTTNTQSIVQYYGCQN